MLCCHKLRGTWDHQKVEKARKFPPLEATKGALPHQQLNFGCLASKIVRKYVSVVLSHSFCGADLGNCSWTNKINTKHFKETF